MNAEDRNNLYTEYESITNELASDERELAQLLKAKIETRLNTWMNTNDDRKWVRDNYAEHSVVDYDRDITILLGDMKAKQWRLDYIKTVLNHSHENFIRKLSNSHA